MLRPSFREKRRRKTPRHLPAFALVATLGFLAVTGVSLQTSRPAPRVQGLWQRVKEFLGTASVVDPIFQKALKDEIDKIRDPTAMMEMMMHAMQGNHEMLARQEAERMEDLTYFHQPTLNRMFNRFDANRDGYLDTQELYNLLTEWSDAAKRWVPTILETQTVETVNIAKAKAKAQGKPIPASAKRDFNLAKKQIKTFADNFFTYDNPVVVSHDIASILLRQMGADDGKLSLENFQNFFLKAMHVERYDVDGIMAKLQNFVASGIREVTAAGRADGSVESPTDQTQDKYDKARYDRQRQQQQQQQQQQNNPDRPRLGHGSRMTEEAITGGGEGKPLSTE